MSLEHQLVEQVETTTQRLDKTNRILESNHMTQSHTQKWMRDQMDQYGTYISAALF